MSNHPLLASYNSQNSQQRNEDKLELELKHEDASNTSAVVKQELQMASVECRICRDTGGDLVRTCRCASPVHLACLAAWFNSGNNSLNMFRCEVCLYPYQYQPVTCYSMYWLLVVYYLLIAVLIGCASLMVGILLSYLPLDIIWTGFKNELTIRQYLMNGAAALFIAAGFVTCSLILLAWLVMVDLVMAADCMWTFGKVSVTALLAVLMAIGLVMAFLVLILWPTWEVFWISRKICLSPASIREYDPQAPDPPPTRQELVPSPWIMRDTWRRQRDVLLNSRCLMLDMLHLGIQFLKGVHQQFRREVLNGLNFGRHRMQLYRRPPNT